MKIEKQGEEYVFYVEETLKDLQGRDVVVYKETCREYLRDLLVNKNILEQELQKIDTKIDMINNLKLHTIKIL